MFTFFTSCTDGISDNNQPEQSSIQNEKILEIDNFILLMESSYDEISTRSSVAFTPAEGNYWVEAAMNKKYAYPWHDHTDLDYSTTNFNVTLDSKGEISRNDMQDFNDDVIKFIACHLEDFTGSNKEVRVVDVEIDEILAVSVNFNVTSVVASLVSNGPPSLSFGSSDEYKIFTKKM